MVVQLSMAPGPRNGKKTGKDRHGGRPGKGRNIHSARVAEEKEIKTLEERIKLESPLPGKSSFSASKASKEDQHSAGQGPSLTAQLFADLPISRRTLAGLQASKYVKMTAIQRGAIPHALCGRDILGEARTGSGKTLSFLVPLLEGLFRNRWSRMDGLGGLVVSPTRELAYQIFQVLSNVGSEHDVSAGCTVGGRSLEEEQRAVASMSVLVATPGRLLQHLDESPGFDASSLLTLVIDEADRILDFGFQETMQHILNHLPKERQTLLFSATLHTSVHRLGRAALRSPEVISVHRDSQNRTPETLKQIFMTVTLDKKVDTLFSFLRSHSQKKIIVFVSTCKQVRFFYEAFKRLKPGPAMMELHGRQSLTKRMVVFQDFTERERAVALVCTDIAARGVDFPAVDWVVQVDCPDCVDSYIHRVGRTARYQSTGQAAIFVLPSEKAFIDKLATARISVRGIAAKQNKVVSIQEQLASLLAGEGGIRHLAQRAFASYIRSVKLMKDKDVFDPTALPTNEFALSLGLADVPLGQLWEADAEDLDKNPLKMRKNQSALQRLKDKIRSKKQGVAAMVEEDEEAEEKRELQQEGPKKKLGRWERRQRRIAAASGRLGETELQTEQDEEEDLLQPVAAGEGSQPPLEVSAYVRKKRLKIRRDGSALGAAGQHTFFGKDGIGETSELAQLAEELRSAKQDPDEGNRSSFLERVARDLASRDVADAVTSRARIHEQHQKKKRKGRESNNGMDEGEVEEFGGDSAISPSRSPSPVQAKATSKRRKSVSISTPTETTLSGTKRPSNLPRKDTPAAGNSLDSLEKEALSKLTGGLFT